MPFGIPNASDLNGIVTNLGTIVSGIGPEAQAVVTTAITQLGAHADALADKAIAAEETAEDKMLQRIDALQATADRAVACLETLAKGLAIVPIGMVAMK